MTTKLVPYSYFKHDSGWGKIFPGLKDTPMFYIQRIDLDGDGDLDEVGHLPLNCKPDQTYYNEGDKCTHDGYLPFTLTGNPPSNSLTIYRGPEDLQTTLKDKDIFYCPGSHSISTFHAGKDPFVVKDIGIVRITDAAVRLVDAFFKMPLNDQLTIFRQALSYNRRHDFRTLISALHSLNSSLPSGDRLSEPQVDLIARLVHRNTPHVKKAVARYLKQPLHKLTEQSFEGAIRKLLKPGVNRGNIGFELAWTSKDLANIKFTPRELHEIDTLFAVPKLLAGRVQHESEERWLPPLASCWTNATPVANLPIQGGNYPLDSKVWFYQPEYTVITSHGILPATLTGVHRFMNVPQGRPVDSPDAYAVQLEVAGRGTFTYPAKQLFIPVNEIPHDFSFYNTGDGKLLSGLKIGDQIMAPVEESSTDEYSRTRTYDLVRVKWIGYRSFRYEVADEDMSAYLIVVHPEDSKDEIWLGRVRVSGTFGSRHVIWERSQ